MLTHRCPWCGEKIPVRFFKPYTFISELADQGRTNTCPSCKKMYDSSLSITLTGFLVLSLISIRFILSLDTSVFGKFVSSIFLLVIGSIGLLYSFRIPYARDYRTNLYAKGNTIVIFVFILEVIIIAAIDIRKNVIIYWMVFISTMICITVYLYRKKHHIYIKEEIVFAQKPSAQVNIAWYPHKQGGLVAPRLRMMKGEIFPVCFMDSEHTPISAALCIVLESIKWEDSHHCSCSIRLVLDPISEEKYFIRGNTFYLYHDYQKLAEGFIH